LHGAFRDGQLKNVEGYRVSACLQGQGGFKDSFRVYIWDREDARNPLDQIEPGPHGEHLRGQLTLDDGDRNYGFNDIDLWDVDVAITRREKFRMIEFRYDQEVIDQRGESPVNMKNESNDLLVRGGLGDSYQYALDDATEDLLGFAAWLRPTSNPMV